MQTTPNDRKHFSLWPPERWRATLVAAATLLASATLLRGEVIDDFEGGRKFMLWAEQGHPELDLTEGQLRINLPESSFAGFLYHPVYELPEGQPVEFRIDLISANTSDVFGLLMVGFAGYPPLNPADRVYEFAVWQDRVGLTKLWDYDSVAWLIDQSVAWNNEAKTMSLTFTREGQNLRIGTKVVLRDDPEQVVFSRETVDRPSSEPTGPVAAVGFGCGTISGNPGAQAVVDNLVSSKDRTSVSLGIQRTAATEATLAWPGINIVLESDSIAGPWEPCPEPVALGTGEYTSPVRCTKSGRFFRSVPGYHITDSFSSGAHWPWRTTSVVPGGTPKPQWSVFASQSRGRIYGPGTLNTDFMLRWGAGIWYRDCVSTVDIIDWGDGMDDAAFGILLRARPPQEPWHSSTAGLPDQRYAGLLTFKKADNPAESALTITGPGGTLLKELRFAAVNPDKQYRLRFWAVGDRLTLVLFDRESLDEPIQTIAVTDGRIPEGMDGLYGTKSTGGTYEVWLDQFMLTGATVY